MNYTQIKYEQEGRVARLVLNRPQSRNAQSRILIEELDDAFGRAADDTGVGAIVLIGAGDHFSAGHDIGTPEQRQFAREDRHNRLLRVIGPDGGDVVTVHQDASVFVASLDPGAEDEVGDPCCGFYGCWCYDLPPTIECDLFAQDCPADEKCMPWSNNGGPAWNATRCSPLDPNPTQVGEPCLVAGSGVSGVDNCDIGLMCWNVDEMSVGVCEDFCTGSEDNPICASPDDVCFVANSGAIALCFAVCDPMVAAQVEHHLPLLGRVEAGQSGAERRRGPPLLLVRPPGRRWSPSPSTPDLVLELGEVPGDHRHLEPRQDRLLRLPLQQELEARVEELLS